MSRAQEGRRTLLGLAVITVVILGAYGIWRQFTAPPFPAEIIAMTPQAFASIEGQPITPTGAPVLGVVRGTHLFLMAGDGSQVPDLWAPGNESRAYAFLLEPAPKGHAAAVRIDLAELRRRIGAGAVKLSSGTAGGTAITVMLP